ncbi:hypothetical protein [Salinimicrobium oceani]|uniref:Membrane metalloprotease n=1 Tax=Salinimicrobium oceani TaxID=2722702 RepID=A0ABX1CU06_9FLAO|nr:hypothetical protein [Salinimicrobium oceani]NJW51770.1 hypothetical protein [Salinimicrobium oceani]
MTFSSGIRFFSWLIIVLLFAGCSVDEAEDSSSSHRNDLVLGASARDFLSDEKFTSLEVEIVYVTGSEPTSEAIVSLQKFLGKYLNKPNGISIKTRAIPSPNLGTYSIDEIVKIEKENRTVFSNDEKLGTYIFFADEKSTDSNSQRRIIGKAYLNTSMVIFEKEIREMASSGTQSEIQTTALHHEFGHLFGLVNNGTTAQTPHVDPDPKKKAHCNVEGCLMNAEIEFGTSPFSFLENGQHVLDFDDQCKLDLRANGGK